MSRRGKQDFVRWRRRTLAMDKASMDSMLGFTAAIAICVGGVIYIWKHPSRRKYDPDETVTVAEFSNPEDARLCKMRLESQGVRCITSGETRTSVAAMLPNADLFSIQLQVLGCDVGRARKILGG